jgi:hypothetical protein
MPPLSSRLEQPMGSNIVRVTDREYMQKLQERICEDHLKMQRNRIQQREVAYALKSVITACKLSWKFGITICISVLYGL